MRLVWVDEHGWIVDAIALEKAKWPRRWKIKLIEENIRIGTTFPSTCCDRPLPLEPVSPALISSNAQAWIPDTLRSFLAHEVGNDGAARGASAIIETNRGHCAVNGELHVQGMEDVAFATVPAAAPGQSVTA